MDVEFLNQFHESKDTPIPIAKIKANMNLSHWDYKTHGSLSKYFETNPLFVFYHRRPGKHLVGLSEDGKQTFQKIQEEKGWVATPKQVKQAPIIPSKLLRVIKKSELKRGCGLVGGNVLVEKKTMLNIKQNDSDLKKENLRLQEKCKKLFNENKRLKKTINQNLDRIKDLSKCLVFAKQTCKDFDKFLIKIVDDPSF